MALKSRGNIASKAASKDGSSEPTNFLAIETIDNEIAWLTTLSHPVLLLSIYFWDFKYMIAHPIAAMTSKLPIVLAVQMLWCIVCLPPAGSVTKKGSKSVMGQVKPAKDKDLQHKSLKNKIVLTVLTLMVTQLAIPILMALLILLGAPFTSHLTETFLASTHFALLAAFPLIDVYGTSSDRWLEVAGLSCTIDEVFGGSVGVLLGAWLGAIPIPLDWDREWQKYPMTVLTGGYIGAAVGKLLGKFMFKGRRIYLGEK